MPVAPIPDPDNAAPSPDTAATAVDMATEGANQLLGLQTLLSHPMAGYPSITGKMAAGGVNDWSLADHYLSIFDQGWKAISSTIPPESRAMFDLSAADTRDDLAQGLARHEAEEKRRLRSYALKETAAKATGAVIAGANDADYAGTARAALKADGVAKGLSGKLLDAQTARDFGQLVIMPVVAARLRDGQVPEARAFFEAHRDGMAAKDADALDTKLSKAENPAALDNETFAAVARTVGLDPGPDALDVEAQAKLGILRAHVNAAIATAEADGKPLSPPERFRMALDAAAQAVNRHSVFGLSKTVQAMLDVKADAMKTPEPKPRPAKPGPFAGIHFDPKVSEKYQYPSMWPGTPQPAPSNHLSLHLPTLEETAKRLSETPVHPGGYTRTIDGRVYIELSTPTGNRIVRDPQDLELERRQRRSLETLDELGTSPLGAGAYGVPNLLHADPDTQQLALDMGTSVDGMAMGFADVDPYRGARPGKFEVAESRDDKYEPPSRRGLPRGFADPTRFAQFSKSLHQGLADAGFRDTRAILQGSSITGQGFKSGAPFDFNRVSDLDIALTGNDIFEMAKAKGIPLYSGRKRTRPLRRRDLEALGLTDIAAELSRQAGRPVRFMVYRDRDKAVRRSISLEISKDEGDN